VKGLGSQHHGRFEHKLVIQSPSKVFAGYGQMTALGYAKGVNDNADVAERQRREHDRDAARGIRRGGLGGTTTNNHRTVGPINITINATDADSFKRSGVLDELVRALEGVLNETGAPLSAPEAA
jgi:hypothetical protein